MVSTLPLTLQCLIQLVRGNHYIQLACEYGHLTVAKYLIEEQHCGQLVKGMMVGHPRLTLLLAVAQQFHTRNMLRVYGLN